MSGNNHWGGGVNVGTGAFPLSPPTQVRAVKAGRPLTDGGESRRVIGSSVTHACLSDSHTSHNKGNAWSASHSTISQKGPISAIHCSVTH